jgi:hypothetical protein
MTSERIFMSSYERSFNEKLSRVASSRSRW